MAMSGIQGVMASGLLLVLAACANDEPHMAAGTPSAAPAAHTASAAVQAGKPKLVCEETKPLGSLLPQRICVSPEEAAARKKASQDAIRNMQNQSSPTQSGPPY